MKKGGQERDGQYDNRLQRREERIREREEERKKISLYDMPPILGHPWPSLFSHIGTTAHICTWPLVDDVAFLFHSYKNNCALLMSTTTKTTTKTITKKS